MFGKIKIPEDFTPEEERAAAPVSRDMSDKRERKNRKMDAAVRAIGKIVGGVLAAQIIFTPRAPISSGRDITIESKEAKDLEKKVGRAAVVGASTRRGLYSEASRSIPNIIGWEKVGISNKAVDQIVRETFPRGWYDKNLGAVRLVIDEKIPMVKEYNILGDALAVCDRDDKAGGRHSIKFGSGAREETPEQLLSVFLSHELAHAHDFRFALIPPEKRLTLFSQIVERLSAENRYKSSYVESINNSDKQAELSDKASEYWAVVVSEYLSEPVLAKYRLAKEDAEIIEGFLAVADPEFKPVEAASKRRKIIGDSVRGEIVKKLPEELKDLGPEKTRIYLEFISDESAKKDILEEDFKRAGFFKKELRQKLKKMPKEWAFLYHQWKSAKHALTIGRANYQSPVPADVASRGVSWNNYRSLFEEELSDFKDKDRERAKVFFEELDGLFDDFSDICQALNLYSIE